MLSISVVMLLLLSLGKFVPLFSFFRRITKSVTNVIFNTTYCEKCLSCVLETNEFMKLSYA